MKTMLARLRLPLLAVLLAACSASGDSRQAPDFTLTGLGGKTASLSALKGRVVLLNFWATWCDSCKEELPTLNAAFHKHAQDPFDLLAVSVEDDATVKVPPFAAEHRLDFPILYADQKVLEAYAVRGLPASYLISADGAIVRRYLGPLDAAKLENDILAALDRRPK